MSGKPVNMFTKYWPNTMDRVYIMCDLFLRSLQLNLMFLEIKLGQQVA